MNGTIGRSFRLAKESYEVLRGNPQLVLFPVISGLVSLVVAASFLAPLFALMMASKGHELPKQAAYPLMFAFYAVSYFVVIFFNSALVTCANEILHGRPATFGDGMRNAARHIVPILGWALLAATVGMVLRMLSERMGIIGRIVVAVLGFAWTMLTYFVVPLLVVENKGPVQALKESGAMLRRTWGEQLAGNFSIGTIFFLLAVLGIIPIGIGIAFAANGIVIPIFIGIVIAMMYWLILAVISSSLTGIYQTAVYMYATTGQVPSGFSPEYVNAAFSQKASKKLWD